MPKKNKEKDHLLSKNTKVTKSSPSIFTKSTNQDQEKTFDPNTFSKYTLVAALNDRECSFYTGPDAWIMKGDSNKEIFAILDDQPWLGVDVSQHVGQNNYPYSDNSAGLIHLKLDAATRAEINVDEDTQGTCRTLHEGNVAEYRRQNTSKCGCNII